MIDADDFGQGARYSLGLATVSVGGRQLLHHTGGMLTFSSSLHVDGEAGVGCFASVNAALGNGYRPRAVTRYAVELMRAAQTGATVEAPSAAATARPDLGAKLCGRYYASDELELTITDGEARGPLNLTSGGETGLLVKAGDVLASDHSRFVDAPLHVETRGDQPISLWWKGTRFANGASTPQPPVPATLKAIEGWYESTDPWVGGVNLRAQGDRLVIDSAGTLAVDSGGSLTDKDSYYSLDPNETVERLRFELPVDGRPQRLSYSGADMLRRSFI